MILLLLLLVGISMLIGAVFSDLAKKHTRSTSKYFYIGFWLSIGSVILSLIFPILSSFLKIFNSLSDIVWIGVGFLQFILQISIVYIRIRRHFKIHPVNEKDVRIIDDLI